MGKEGFREIERNMTHTNICTLGTPGGGEEPGTVNLFRKGMTETFCNLTREGNHTWLETQRIPGEFNRTEPS